MNRMLRLGALAGALLAAGCVDGTMGPVGGGSGWEPLYVELDGPSSVWGVWRYEVGGHVLECDVDLRAEAWGGGRHAEAEWVDGVVDFYDLRSGRYLGTDYFHGSDLDRLWGSRWIESGERRYARTLRYAAYDEFSAEVEFYYRADGRLESARHRFDCR